MAVGKSKGTDHAIATEIGIIRVTRRKLVVRCQAVPGAVDFRRDLTFYNQVINIAFDVLGGVKTAEVHGLREFF